MEILQISLRALAPLFLVIVAGYFCKRIGVVSEAEQPRMSAVGVKIFLPILFFYNIYTSEIDFGTSGVLLGFCAVGVTAVFLGGAVFARFFEKKPERRGTIVQALFRSNYILLGIPIVTALYPEAAGLASLVGAVIVPMYNIFAVIALETFNGKKVPVRKLVMGIVKNPLIIASLLGIFCMLLGVKLPGVVEKAIANLAGIASPYLLFLLGVFFRFRLRFDKGLAACLLGRLIVVPGVILAAAALLGIRDGAFAIVMILFGAPAAVNSFTMAQQMGGDAELAGNAVVLGSALSFFTIFLWNSLFMYFGML